MIERDDSLIGLRKSILEELAIEDLPLAKAILKNNYFVSKVAAPTVVETENGDIYEKNEIYHIIDCNLPFVDDKDIYVEYSKKIWEQFENVYEWYNA